MVGLLSFGAAAVWFAYTSLSPSSEGWDPFTTALIGVLPLALRVPIIQKGFDDLLAPFASLRRQVPGALLTGAAFGLPFVVGLFCALSTSSGYWPLRFSISVSILGSYVLSRKPRLF
jgi:hypothetical protein